MSEKNVVRNVIGGTVTMSDENGRHFIGAVPDQRECAGRQFRVKAVPIGGAQTTIFLCLRCTRELEGVRFSENDSHLVRNGGQIP
jgi:hypothetical protein